VVTYKSMACLAVTCLDGIFDKIISLVKNNLHMHRPKLQLNHERNIDHTKYHPIMRNQNGLLSYTPSSTGPCRLVGSTPASCTRRVVPHYTVQLQHYCFVLTPSSTGPCRPVGSTPASCCRSVQISARKPNNLTVVYVISVSICRQIPHEVKTQRFLSNSFFFS